MSDLARIEIRRLQIADDAIAASHGMTHPQDYIVMTDDAGFRFAVTPYQGGWLVVDPEYPLDGELGEVLMEATPSV
jgi:hypothetical protein